MFPGRNGLPDLCFKITHLPVYRSFHFQVFKTFSYQCQTSFHIHYILVQTAYLSQTKQTILTDPLIQYRQLFFYRFIFLRSLEIVLPRYQLPLHQPLVLSVTTFLYNEFFLNTDTILLQTQPFLLHTYTSITQLIFLIGQICFTLHDTDIQQRITQAQNHIPFLYHRSFFMKAFLHSSAFYSIEVNHAAGKYLSNHTDIIIKLIFCNCSDSDTALVNGHGRTGITKNKIKNEYQYE